MRRMHLKPGSTCSARYGFDGDRKLRFSSLGRSRCFERAAYTGVSEETGLKLPFSFEGPSLERDRRLREMVLSGGTMYVVLRLESRLAGLL